MKKDSNVIYPDDVGLRYSGRIDFGNVKEPTFIDPYSSVATVFMGTKLDVIVRNHRAYCDNWLGYVIDGVQGRVLLPYDEAVTRIHLVRNLEDREHTVFFFKRQDGCHYFDFLGFVLSETGVVRAPNQGEIAEVSYLPCGARGTATKAEEEAGHRRMEIYGDSVSAGEVSEALDYIGQADPVHNGEYSNAYWSYSALTARKLGAELHIVAQGGIALLPGTGYFEPDFGYLGMDTSYHKLRYNPALGKVSDWDFALYTPHVVVIAIGQNDNFPEDYMKLDYDSVKAQYWRERYGVFLRNMRDRYPKALIVTTTTILEHDASWDRAIDEVTKGMQDERLVHFLYQKNGCGTPGHIRKPEAEGMAAELSALIESFGEEIWK